MSTAGTPWPSQRSITVREPETKSIKKAIVTFYCYAVMICLFIISRRAVEKAPSMTSETWQTLFGRLLWESSEQRRKWCLRFVVSLHLSVVYVHPDCFSRLINQGRKCWFICSDGLQQAWEQTGSDWPIINPPINKHPQSSQAGRDGVYWKPGVVSRSSPPHLCWVNPTILPEVLCQFAHKSQRGVNSVSALHRLHLGRHHRSSLLSARGEEVKFTSIM